MFDVGGTITGPLNHKSNLTKSKSPLTIFIDLNEQEEAIVTEIVEKTGKVEYQATIETKKLCSQLTIAGFWASATECSVNSLKKKTKIFSN